MRRRRCGPAPGPTGALGAGGVGQVEQPHRAEHVSTLSMHDERGADQFQPPTISSMIPARRRAKSTAIATTPARERAALAVQSAGHRAHPVLRGAADAQDEHGDARRPLPQVEVGEPALAAVGVDQPDRERQRCDDGDDQAGGGAPWRLPRAVRGDGRLAGGPTRHTRASTRAARRRTTAGRCRARPRRRGTPASTCRRRRQRVLDGYTIVGCMTSTYTANGTPSRSSRSRTNSPAPLRCTDGGVSSPATRNSSAIRNKPNGTTATNSTNSTTGWSVISRSPV